MFQYEADLIHDVVLLINHEQEVVDAFEVRGKTRHPGSPTVTHYTYRSLLTPEGYCAVCGNTVDQQQKPCTSSGGFHAFVGMENEPLLDPRHKVESRSLPLHTLVFEEFRFWVEPDNLFPIDQILIPLDV